MAKHRSHSIEFKRQVAQEFLAGETLHGLANRHDLSRNLIRLWVQKYEAGAFDEDAGARHDLLEILEERYGRRSTIVTSQLPVNRWHEIIGDPTYADAILDRIVHNAHRIELAGESMRRTRGKQNQKA